MKTKFFTSKGDKGTSVFGKKKLPKDDALFDVLGDLDELNSWLGFAEAGADKNIGEILKKVQESLFMVQADFAAIGFGFKTKGFSEKIGLKTIELEKIITDTDKKLPAIKKFILPGGSELAAKLDIARVIARRSERAAVGFSRKKKVPDELLRFLNRLSSLLFALARYANRIKGVKEKNPMYN